MKLNFQGINFNFLPQEKKSRNDFIAELVLRESI